MVHHHVKILISSAFCHNSCRNHYDKSTTERQNVYILQNVNESYTDALRISFLHSCASAYPQHTYRSALVLRTEADCEISYNWMFGRLVRNGPWKDKAGHCTAVHRPTKPNVVSEDRPFSTLGVFYFLPSLMCSGEQWVFFHKPV